ncbi:MAG: bifunctional [glutamate--ammonia ligase]-adenylyl-L-tyrosine phosphorylase/[glutamate--ammonia-ligase] adenylyltransferase [Gammaproteobacteria bacterium]|nr:bifunctional [glutamate--ammonia ligase]-adenylyl-L-tyrosine phosphorylase/[glutamate--ammonia-ligase] adenylyltransferase [Gammaproteobacteria bacterium]
MPTDAPHPPFQRALARLPEPLRPAVERHWSRYVEAAERERVPVAGHPEFLRGLCRVWAGSEYAAQCCAREPALLAGLQASGDLFAADAPGELLSRLDAHLGTVLNDDHLAQLLRTFRRREMVRIIWRDLAGWSDLDETMADLSRLAECCIGAALDRLDAWQRKEYGTPAGADGAPQSLVVLGMGKLGAGELNLSSDVDLIFAYPEDGETRGRRPRMANEEYFIRLGRRLIAVLDAQTRDGFVFRVDMRLRPFGGSGPLAMSFDALEEYYQEQGREWERYAMIKARVVGGDRARGGELLAALRPFVYRRYLDFGAFESLREMKEMIAREVRRKGIEDNVKTGPGGIREVEFIGQAFQLIRGGRDTRLQERRILRVLRVLAERRYLPEFVSRELAAAYVFLRRVEHRLQAVADQQTQRLPDDELDRLRLAHSMGYADWTGFLKALRGHMGTVHAHFEQVIAAPQAEAPAAESGGHADLESVWRGRFDAGQAREVLARAGLDDVAEVHRRLEQLRGGTTARVLGRQGRERLDRLMPLLLGAVGKLEAPARALYRVLDIIEAVAGRSAYLALLVENPMALSQLVRLCAASPWIATELARHPLLLDELLDPRSLYAPPRGAALEDELRQQMLRVPEEDLEQQMELLRHFRQAQVLRVAAADMMGALPLMKVSDHLTEIAEVVLRQVLDLAWSQMALRYGLPTGQDGQRLESGFVIIAYGKLGGLELGYGSDLDLVFLHGGDPDGNTAGGPRTVANGVFFARLGQRIIHVLNTLTPAGVLYEVDMRLRPSGASGLLVSSLDAFAEYQREDAWTWEHQALVRARPVAGDAALGARFDGIRRAVLGRRRERGALAREVREMRQRMREALGSREAGWFDLKQDPGGIADIEFMVQYGVLLWSSEHPELLRYPDNIRILEGLAAAGLMDPADAELLADAYRAYREVVHRCALQQEPARVEEGAFNDYRQAVRRIWAAQLET